MILLVQMLDEARQDLRRGRDALRIASWMVTWPPLPAFAVPLVADQNHPVSSAPAIVNGFTVEPGSGISDGAVAYPALPGAARIVGIY